MLYWNTVSDLLKECLLKLMKEDVLSDFRLVGGTALSLHLGHRVSMDIDLFAFRMHGEINFDAIEDCLKNVFVHVEGEFGGNPGLGRSYLIGTGPDNVIKLDIYYSMEPFFQDVVEEDGIHMASVEEIIAMKVDVVHRKGRKKDFWDLHEVLPRYGIKEMISLHQARYEWTHEPEVIRHNFTDFIEADGDLDPICLRGKYWEFVKADIKDAVEASD